MAFKSVTASSGVPQGQRPEAKASDTASPLDNLASLMGEASAPADAEAVTGDSGESEGELDLSSLTGSSDKAEPDLDIGAMDKLDDSLPPPASAPELEIKSDGKMFKFKLDPEDKDLRRTLEWGKAAPRFVKERKEAQREVERLKQENGTLSQQASRIAELEDILKGGNEALAVKALLGEEGYKKFFNDQVFKRVRYELADDADEKAKIAQEFLNAEREQERFLNNREIKKRDEKLASYEFEKHAQVQRSIAESEYYRFSFAQHEQDETKQEALQHKLWKLAMSDIEEYADDVKKNTGKDPVLTREQYRKAFETNYKFLVGNRKAAAAPAAKKAEEKQAVEKKKAATVARQAAPAARQSEGFESLNVLDRLSALRNFGR